MESIGMLLWLPTPLTLVFGGVRSSHFLSINPYIPPSGQQLHHSSGVCPQIQGRQCGVYVGAVEEMRWCGCCRGDIVVMNVIWRRLCVSMIWGREICLFWVGQVNWGKSLFRAANVWWRCICIWHMFVDLQFRLPVSMKLSSRIALLTCPINSHVTYQWGEVLHVDPFHSLVGLKNQLTSVAFCRNT